MRDIVSPISGFRSPFGQGRGSPALSLNFAQTGTLDSRITFSRTSHATMFDSTGKLTYAPNNLLTYSEQFDNAAWAKSLDGQVAVTANATTAPNGTLTADLCVPSAINGYHNIRQASAVSAAGQYIYSAYAKAYGSSYPQISFREDFAAGAYASFDLSTGVAYTVSGSATMTAVPGYPGWYLCSWVNSQPASHGIGIYIQTAAYNPTTTSPFANTYTGNATDGVYLWGAQIERVTYETTPRTYNPTTAAAYYGPRFDYDPSTLAARGLLIEEARTNLVVGSQMGTALGSWNGNESTRTLSAEVAPDGTLSAMQIVTTGNSGLNLLQVMTTVASSVYTASMWLKGTAGQQIYFGPDGSSAAQVLVTFTGNWQRIERTFTATGTTSFINCERFNRSGGAHLPDVTFHAWGAQYELGSFATSYIPTAAASVTRAADSASMTGTNFSSWYNQSEGTFVAQAAAMSLNTNMVFRAYNAGDTSRHQIYYSSGGVISGTVTAGVAQSSFTLGSLSNGTFAKAAYAYNTNDFNAAVNGAAGTTDTSGTVPIDISVLSIGDVSGGGFKLNGHIASLTYYNKRLSNATLQTLTA